MALIISSGDLILEVLKCQILISHFVQGLLNWRNNIIWLQLCLSILANYQFLHLQKDERKILSVVLGYLFFVSSNRTDICFLSSLNRRQINVYNPDAVQNGVLCEVDIRILGRATCCTNNRTVSYKKCSM